MPGSLPVSRPGELNGKARPSIRRLSVGKVLFARSMDGKLLSCIRVTEPGSGLQKFTVGDAVQEHHHTTYSDDITGTSS